MFSVSLLSRQLLFCCYLLLVQLKYSIIFLLYPHESFPLTTSTNVHHTAIRIHIKKKYYSEMQFAF